MRHLQRKLWAAAKQSPERRFRALFDRIHRGDVLWEAWRRVRTHRGAAGIDQVTLAAVEAYGVERMLVELQADLEQGRYRPAPARRVDIPKPAGGVRPLGIPTVGDRISPLLANIVLHELDRQWQARDGILVRYADDFVVMCRSQAQAEDALATARGILTGLGLQLHPDKTKVVDLREGREGFDFLGCHFHARMSGRLWEQHGIRRSYLHRWPWTRSMKRVRQKIKALTGRNRAHADIRETIDLINPILRGWGNYVRTGNAARTFNQIDAYVWRRLRRLLVKRYGRNLHAGRADAWTRDWFVAEHGLHRLRGTVRYPGAA